MSQLQRVVVEAPAKVNLFFEITGLAPNGYHLVDTVMQAISLSDLVVVGRRSGRGIRVTCSRPEVPENKQNLVWKAAKLLLQEAGKTLRGGLHIHIDKTIPSQAGMGGGSADAAALLIGLDRLLGTGFTPEKLGRLGLVLGADLPFALAGGCARVGGIGERMAPLPGLLPCFLVIAKPAVQVSTAQAYWRYDRAEGLIPGDREALPAALAAADLTACGKAMFNIFEQACPLEETGRIKAAMESAGALGAVLTGSGSAVVGLFAREKKARACAQTLKNLAQEVFVTRPVDHGPKIVHQS